MRGISWPRTNYDTAILDEIRNYAVSTNGCFCMFPTIKITVNNSHPTRLYVIIQGKTQFKENLAYYNICNTARGYGAQAH